jgi:hypothetical protein
MKKKSKKQLHISIDLQKLVDYPSRQPKTGK